MCYWNYAGSKHVSFIYFTLNLSVTNTHTHTHTNLQKSTSCTKYILKTSLVYGQNQFKFQSKI